MTPMWGGRFSQDLDPTAHLFNASIAFDRRLGSQDVRGSLAWARALRAAGALSSSEADALLEGLSRVNDEITHGQFVISEEDEDIHSAVERRLGELVGPLAGKLHTGRSRNDQVATDLRLWLLDNLPHLDDQLAGLQQVLIDRAQREVSIIMPGYTHTQRAQPISLGHWWLSHAWPLQRDRVRLRQVRAGTAWLPLGSGALSGTAYPIDRTALARDLGFDAPCPNSLDAVADRDFAAEFLFSAALIGVHLSRLAEAIILFSTREFGFLELSDAFTTGSSLMPQKKNPDVFELARAKAGTLIGLLTGLLATLKGLPSAYDKDLQEDKPPVFQAFDILAAALPALAGAVRTLSIHADRMAAAVDEDLLAVDLADHLARRGLPFRQAHEIVGQWVRRAQEQGSTMASLPARERAAIHPALEAEVESLFDPGQSLARRNQIGGTGPSALEGQLIDIRGAMASLETMTPPGSTAGGLG